MRLCGIRSGESINIRTFNQNCNSFLISVELSWLYGTATMKTFISAIFVCTIGLALANCNVKSAFENSELKPDLVDVAPKNLIKIKFGDKAVKLGNVLTPTEVKDLPKIKYNHECDAYYTLVMTDPDVPNREAPVGREWHHWLVGNIPGDEISEGDVITPFVSSAPMEGTGLHRYTFIVYKQPDDVKIEFEEVGLTNTYSVTGREGFSTSDFAAKYNLGNPIAGNYYQAEWDEYVPTVHKQLGL